MSKLNIKAEDKTQEYILAYLEENASASLVDRINAGKKTLSGCLSYLSDWARKELKPKGGVAGAPDEVVFGQAIHYFEEDSLDFEKKEPVATVKAGGTKKPAAAPVKAKGNGKAKVAVQSADSLDLDSMLSSLNIEVVGEKKTEPTPVAEPAAPEPQPEAPPAPEERKEPKQLDWLAEFGISI